MIRTFIQARMSSTRFPGKVLAPLNGRRIIIYVMAAPVYLANADKLTERAKDGKLCTSFPIRQAGICLSYDIHCSALALMWQVPASWSLIQPWRRQDQSHHGRRRSVTSSYPTEKPASSASGCRTALLSCDKQLLTHKLLLSSKPVCLLAAFPEKCCTMLPGSRCCSIYWKGLTTATI